MNIAIKEILSFISENDVKFIRLSFCDLFGTQKNISIMPNQLQKVFEDGMAFDGSNILGFSNTECSDLLLFPDASTLNILPWRPQEGRVIRFYCDIKNPNKTPYKLDTRAILKAAVKRCKQMGYEAKVGTECEFYLFETDEKGAPTKLPFDKGSYFDISPLDRGENVRREICLCLEDMGIKPESSYHESGPGQNEIDFRCDEAQNAADNFLTFKSVVKAISARNGLFSSFMPKPILEKSGSGLHINISLFENGCNIFENEQGNNKIAQSFIDGVLDKVPDITAILNPIINSYERLGKFETPKYIELSNKSLSQLVRIPCAVGEKTRMELRTPDCSANPYLALAGILHAGLDGIEKEKKLSQPVASKNLDSIPKDLLSALNIFENSDFIKKIFDEELIKKYVSIKKEETEKFQNSDNKENFYMEEYFERI